MNKKLINILIVLVLSTFMAFLAMIPVERIKTQKAYPWMSEVSDDYLINEMSIPGTHDSGATHSIFDVAGKCQDLSIKAQLNIGVRFFDLRLQLKNEQLEVVHSFVEQKVYFADVIEAMIDFIKEYDTEFLIISIKEEANVVNSSKTFLEVLEGYLTSEVFDLSNQLPKTLKEARGKIYLLSRINVSYGIQAYEGWEDSTTFTLGDLYIQDNYCIDDIEVKKSDIITTLQHSNNNRKQLVLNFTSCYIDNAFPPTYAATAALKINPWFFDYLDENDGSVGIIIADFMTYELARKIYRRNIL